MLWAHVVTLQDRMSQEFSVRFAGVLYVQTHHHDFIAFRSDWWDDVVLSLVAGTCFSAVSPLA